MKQTKFKPEFGNPAHIRIMLLSGIDYQYKEAIDRSCDCNCPNCDEKDVHACPFCGRIRFLGYYDTEFGIDFFHCIRCDEVSLGSGSKKAIRRMVSDLKKDPEDREIYWNL